jgi:hypothetical protein
MKKLLASALTGLIFLFSFSFPVFAQTTTTPTTNSTTWYNQTFQDWYGKVYNVGNPNEIFGERYTAAQVQWIIYGLWGFLINTATGPQNAGIVQCFLSNVTNIDTCADQLLKLVPTTGTSDRAIDTQNLSRDQSLWKLVFATDRPISGIAYIKERLDNFSLVPVAHAQTPGFGFNVLKPIQSMWVGIRNISYGLFVVATVILAFMIMFRVKINPQTVISVQSAIPKVVVALILTTFSYAIAGLMIDLMYVVIGLVSLVAPSLTVFKVSGIDVFKFLTQSNIFLVLVGYLTSLAISLVALTTISIGAILTAAAAEVTTALILGSGGALLLLIVILIVIVVLVIAWMIIKIIWSLVKAFATILLLVIFGPLQIAAGVIIPNFGFTAWLRSLASALGVFVVTGVLLLFSIVFLVNGVMLGLQDFLGGGPGAADLGQTVLHFFLGTVIGGIVTGQGTPGWPPLLNGGGADLANVGLLFLGVSFVLFTLIPKANDLIQSILSGKPFAYGTAIGEATTFVGGGAALAKETAARAGVTLPKNVQTALDDISRAANFLSGGTRRKP